MAILGSLLALVGALASLAGGIWIIVLAFQESPLWGLGCIFVPFVALVFAIMNWETANRAFLLNLGGGVIMVIGMVLAAAGGGG